MLLDVRLVALLLALPLAAWSQSRQPEDPPRIQIALILDVSGSMDGLAKHAKGALWQLTSGLQTASRQGWYAQIEIALISTGNLVSSSTGYSIVETGLTTDLDSISEVLFAIGSTPGSAEHFGQALELALDRLNWSTGRHDYRTIVVAGNEAFDQGDVSYPRQCKRARKRRITINTVLCGTSSDSLIHQWRDAAVQTGGESWLLDQDQELAATETFWDSKIFEFNDRLNETYVPFGRLGKAALERQRRQDANALAMGNNFLRQRVAAKVSDSYRCESWDLVDAFETDSLILSTLTEDQLPIPMRGLAMKERVSYLQLKATQRALFRSGASAYYQKANDALSLQLEGTSAMPLGHKLAAVIERQATKKGFTF